jgi:hypothetical protein
LSRSSIEVKININNRGTDGQESFMTKDQERRGRTRVDYQGRAEVWLEGARLSEVVLRDISINGLFAETGQKVKLDQACEVAILLGPSEDQTVRVEGRVSRLEPSGFAIEFKGIDPESYSHLRNIVLYNAREPDKVEAEFNRPGIK